MASNNLPKAFVESIKEYEKYPKSIVERAQLDVDILCQHSYRLAERAKKLSLFVSEDELLIPYREVGRDGVVANKSLIKDRDVLQYLSDGRGMDSCNPQAQVQLKEDPAYRAIFLNTGGSTLPIETTLKSLKRILTYFQVTPDFLDFLYVFSGRDGLDSELRFSGFRTNVALSASPHPGLTVSALGRSGRRYQVCYTLKRVEVNELQEGAYGHGEWKIRNGVFHHQFDVVAGTQLWIVGDQKTALHKRTGRHLNDGQTYPARFNTCERSFGTSLDMHLVYCRSGCQNWRWYICSLEERVQKMTIHCLGPPQFDDEFAMRWDPKALGVLQEEEERVNNCIMALEANEDIMARIIDFYGSLVNNPDFPDAQRQACYDRTKRFTSVLKELIYDLKTQRGRAVVLSKLITDRKDILTQHLQMQAAAQQERFATTLWKQAEKTALETMAVRIIAVITLLFLPATFVATVFSTDIVKTHLTEKEYAMEPRSLFLMVSLPLMVITFGFAVSWYRFERWRKRREMKREIRVLQTYEKDPEAAVE